MATTNYQLIRQEVLRRERYAEDRAPKDALTRLARWLTRGIRRVLKPINTVVPVTTSVGRPINRYRFTAGLYGWVLHLLWMGGYLVIHGLSWLWLRYPVSRPILLLPGPIIAMLGYLLFILLPDASRGNKYWRLALCDSWPLTYLLAHAPASGDVESASTAARNREGRRRSARTQKHRARNEGN